MPGLSPALGVVSGALLVRGIVMGQSIAIVVTSHYGTLSRGRHSARQGNGVEVRWAEKNANGQIVITEPGVWMLHCSDGYNRSARAVLTVDEDGGWEMTGETKRFDVIA